MVLADDTLLALGSRLRSGEGSRIHHSRVEEGLVRQLGSPTHHLFYSLLGKSRLLDAICLSESNEGTFRVLIRTLFVFLFEQATLLLIF